jgi:hypothetical protein
LRVEPHNDMAEIDMDLYGPETWTNPNFVTYEDWLWMNKDRPDILKAHYERLERVRNRRVACTVCGGTGVRGGIGGGGAGCLPGGATVSCEQQDPTAVVRQASA